MPYVFTMDVPINLDVYQRIRTALGDDPPTGMIAHVVVEREDGGLRYIELWESEDAWERFSDERLHPVVWATFERAGLPRAPEPDRNVFTVHDLWAPSVLAKR